MSYFGQVLANLGFRNQKSVDGRLRISQQISLGDYKQYLNNAGGQYNTELIGEGLSTYEGNVIGGSTFTTTDSADVVIRQTYQWHNYFAGKPQKIELTTSRFDKQTNITKRLGYYSSNTTTPFNSTLDGLFFESTDAGIYCKIYRAGTEIFSLEQANWLNQNELTNYDPTDFNFHKIEFLYLGGVIANFWIATEHGMTLIASYEHIGVDHNAFIKSPNQPVRYEMRQTGVGTGEFNQICADVATEGQSSIMGVNNSYNTDGNKLTSLSTNVRYAMLGIRQKAASRNVPLILTGGSILSTTNDDMLLEIFFGGTTVGTPTWGSTPFTNEEHFSSASDIAGGNSQRVHSGGVLIYSAYMQGGDAITNTIQTIRRLGSYIDGQTEEMYICITSLTSNGGGYGAVNWVEFI